MQPHIANTKVTTVQAHEEREKVLNAHMMMWTIVLGPQKRTAKNFQAWNNDIPALYGLRKDHKGCLIDGSVEDIAECSGGEIGDFEYDAGIDLGVVVAEDGCGGGIGGCGNGCSGGCEDDSDIDSLCIEVVAESE
ncbi:Hypothetical predicted protein [Octopus vulgaris]|uniref:Uncharacterized protein n=1 Tax=Octopus vulgaris TaxID=6645 RepID=A0AA36ASF1_OCTVU|nr:Hypothetical predicted protein [Octopus vulgaris]